MAGEARRRRIRALLRALDIALEVDDVERAFVHDSADPRANNERLEWLGDSVLGFATARWLYGRYPTEREGELTRRKHSLVSDRLLAITSRSLGIGDVLVMSEGESAAGGAERESNLAGAFEALVGAVYLGAGAAAATQLVERYHLSVVERADMVAGDPKTQLQEYSQAQHGELPTYEDEFTGPAHSRTFTSRVRVRGELLGEGIGSSKKTAQRAAAQTALARLGDMTR